MTRFIRTVAAAAAFALLGSNAAFAQVVTNNGTQSQPTNPNGVTILPAIPVVSGGTGGYIGAGPALLASSGALNTTETVLATDPLGPVALAAGTTFDIKLFGTCTASAANNSTFTIRYGSTGTTADTAIGTFVVASATSGSAIPFALDLPFTVRTIGAGTAATIYGFGALVNNGTTGLATTATAVGALTATAFNSTGVGNYVSVTYKSAATTTTSTFQNAIVAVVHP